VHQLCVKNGAHGDHARGDPAREVRFETKKVHFMVKTRILRAKNLERCPDRVRVGFNGHLWIAVVTA
jgi:hypothetical protein